MVLLLIATASLPTNAAAITKIQFRGEIAGREAREFTSLVGNWHIDRDGASTVYAVDGRKWEQGLMSRNAAQKVKQLYGQKSMEFLAGLTSYRYFPLSVCKPVERFRSGIIQTSFKAVSGRIDQGAGLAFDIQPNGNYMVLRVNPLENNMVLFKMEGGRRSSVQWTRNVPTPSGQWQTLKIAVRGTKIQGYLNDKKYLDYTSPQPINGRVGLWSKADSYVFFDNFLVTGE
jgi:hypothetical protein